MCSPEDDKDKEEEVKEELHETMLLFPRQLVEDLRHIHQRLLPKVTAHTLQTPHSC